MESEEKIRSLAPVEQQDIDEIVLWLETRPHLPQNIPGDLIKSFLHSNYLNIESTKKTIETYYQLKTTTPDFFDNRNLNGEAMQLICDTIDLCILPKKSLKGYVIVFARLKDSDPNKFVLEDAIKLLFMTIDSIIASDPVPSGFVFVFDNQGTSVRHLLKVSISVIKKYLTYLQEAIPVRMKQIHVINVNFIVTQIMALMRPFLDGSHEILLHTSDRIDDLYKAVPQEVMPAEYGGNEASLDILKANSYNQVRKCASWFENDETLRIDESKRKKSEDYSGIAGFFRRISMS